MMNSQSLPWLSFLPLLPILQFLILMPQLSRGSSNPDYPDEVYYQSCGNMFNCGDISDVGYPFRSDNDPPYCGHPGFELSCNEGNTTIDIMNETYRVLEINQTSKTMKIVREDMKEGNCPQEFNTTLDNTLFEYTTTYINLTLLYGCHGGINNIPGIGTIPCGDSNDAYVLPAGTGVSVNCSSSMIVPVPVVGAGYGGIVDSTLLMKTLKEGQEIRWKMDSKACDECTKSKGRCGLSLFTNQTTCYCPSPPYVSETCSVSIPTASSASPVPDNSNNDSNKTPLMPIGVGIAGAALAGVGIGLLIFRQKRKWVAAKALDHEQVLPVQNIEAFVRTKGFHATKLYTYSDIKKMTNSFNDKIGQGGFGSVYRGKLPDGRAVAVKLLTNTKGNGEDFINEVGSISRTSHVNIVTLVGFCYRKKRALVYEFMPNGSLDKYIGNKGLQNMSCLEWKTLYQIAIGIARGLEYLHRGCNTRIMHFDIKPNNILLDKDFTPKISDFGLAKLCKKKESVVSLSVYGARGTIGYIAPEVFCRNIGSVSHKSDVYSYGMTIIDMIGVRENVHAAQTSDLYFPNWIYEHLEQGIDFSLEGITDAENKEMAMKMMLVSLWCIQTNPADRPSITKVVEMLEGSTATLQVPPKPFFCPPIDDSPQQSPTSSVTTEI